MRAGYSYEVVVHFVTGSINGDIDDICIIDTRNFTTTAFPGGIVKQGLILEISCETNPAHCDSGPPRCFVTQGHAEMVGKGTVLNPNASNTPAKDTFFPSDCNAPTVYLGPRSTLIRDGVLYNPNGNDSNFDVYTILDGNYTPYVRFVFQTDLLHTPTFERYEIRRVEEAFSCPNPRTAANFDRGHRYTINPGFLSGDIRLVGPLVCPSGSPPSSLAQLVTGQLRCPTNPEYQISNISASTPLGPLGDSNAVTSFLGVTSVSEFNGHYELWMGALNEGQFSNWNIGVTELVFHSADSDGDIEITDDLASGTYQAALTVEAQKSYTADLKYCMSEITVDSVLGQSGGGITIGNPSILFVAPSGYGTV